MGDDIELTGNIVIDSSAVNTDRVGDYSVTYDVTDTAGNAAEQKTRTVRVIDTGKPIITLTGDNPQTIEFGMAYTETRRPPPPIWWMATSPATLSLTVVQ